MPGLSILWLFWSGLAAAWFMPAHADDLRPITLVVGYPAGGSTDVLARVVAEGMSARLSTSVIVVNRPGASGRLAVAEVKRSTPDGSVLLFTNASPMVIFPHIYPDLAYDPQKDFVPVAIAARTDLVFSIGPGVPESVKTLKEYVTWVKSHASQASFGSVQGTSPDFAGQLLSSTAGLNLHLIPYKGGAQVVSDLIGGHVPAAMNALGEARPFEHDGGLRMLAVMSSRRSALAPNVPSIAELGYAGLDFSGWIGVLAPAGTPSATIERLNAAIGDTLKAPAVVAQVNRLGMEPEVVSSSSFKATIAADTINYKKAVALTGFKAQD